MKIKTEPKAIFEEYANGTNFKNQIGNKGIADQTKMNERFYAGDQWHGVNCGNDKPLVRQNIIKRIGEFKISATGSAPISVNYSADGVPFPVDSENVKSVTENLKKGIEPQGKKSNEEIAAVMQGLSDYFDTTAERDRLNQKCYKALKKAYISGTGLMYVWWDDTVRTGLYADEGKTKALNGDIRFSVIDVENVVFGEPNNDDVQSQPYIIIAQRLICDDVRREAKKNRISDKEIEMIKPDGCAGADGIYLNSGDRGTTEPQDSSRITVFTKLYKEYDDNGVPKIKAVKCTERATVRRPWELKLTLYPLAKFSWEERHSSIYGESEITYLIPNQIALNRILTAEVWAVMSAGMPKMIVNGDIITDEVSNDPGEIIKVFGSNDDVANAIRYVVPPNFGATLTDFSNNLAENTLRNTGANDAALGDMNPENASAIISLREAAMQPIQAHQNNYNDFWESIARISADFWFNYYGKRPLKISDKSGIWYMPFDGERYKELVINAKIDVGASTIYSEAATIQTLSNLLETGKITALEFFERLPKKFIPDVTGIIESRKAMQNEAQASADITDDEIITSLQATDPEAYQQFLSLSTEEQRAFLENAKAQQSGGMTNDSAGLAQ